MHKKYLMGLLMDSQPGAGGGGDAPAFDPAAFRAEIKNDILGEVNKTLNGGMSRLERLIAKGAQPPANGDPNPEPKTDDPKPGGDPRFAALERQMENDRKKREQLEKDLLEERNLRVSSERKANLNKALDIEGEAFKSPQYRNTVLRELVDAIAYDEHTGEVITPDNTPLAEFAANLVKTKFPDLLAPKQVGGAGAGPGGRGSGAKAIDLNMKLDTPEAISAYRAEVARVAGQALRGSTE